MSEYKEKLDKLIFSFSSLSQYEECPYAFYMNKIMKIKGDSNAYADVGSFGHKLCAEYLSGASSLENILIKCVEDFNDNVTHEMSESSKEKKYVALCEYFSSFEEDSFKKRFKVLGVEKKFFWKIDGHRMIGIVDLILKDKNTGKIYLVDHKSSPHFLRKDGKPLKNMGEAFAKYKKQMYLYVDAMLKNQYFGYRPDYIVWNHFLDDGKLTVIPFNDDDYRETMEWASDTIKRIYDEVEFPPCMESYIMCNELCNYRDGYCEYVLIDTEDD